MQYYKSAEYSSTECYSSSTGLDRSDMGLLGYGSGGQFGGQNMMMARAGGKTHGWQQQYRYDESQAQSNYGMDEYEMHNGNNRYREHGQAYYGGGGIVPYGAGGEDHMSYNKKYMSKANTGYGTGGYGGLKQGVMVGTDGVCIGGGGFGGGRHYPLKQQAPYCPGGMEYVSGMNQQQQIRKHRKSEKNGMFQKMQAMSMSSSSSSASSRRNYNTSSRAINYGHDEDSSDGEYSDGHDSCSDDEFNDSWSDYEGGRRRNYGRPNIH